MMRIVRVLVLATLVALPGRAALGQIKIGSVSGAPGALTFATGVAFQATGNIGYLSNPGSGLVQKFSLSSGLEIASLDLPDGIGPITLSSDGRTLAVVGVTAQKVYLINTADMKIRHELSAPGSGFTGRTNILMSQDGRSIFIADPPRNGVESWNGTTGEYERLIAVGNNPVAMSTLPRGDRFGVLSSGKNADDVESLHVVDMTTRNVLESRNLSLNTEDFNNIQFTNDNRYMMVPAFNNNALHIMTLNSTGVLGSFSSGGRGPTKIVTSPNGVYLAVVNATSRNIAILKLPLTAEDPFRTLTLSDTPFPNDAKPVFSSDSRRLYIPSNSTGQIIVYDIEGGRITSRISVGQGPTMLAVSPDGKILTSVDTGSNELSIVALAALPLHVPHLTQTPTEYSGLALANFDSTEGGSATVTLVARDDQGGLLSGTTNPRTLTIPTGRQISLVAAQIFGFNSSSTLSGWIEAYTLGPSVSMLYLTGTIGQTQLDGFPAIGTTGRLLSLARITEGVSAFGSTTQTEILLVNPSDDTANLTLRLHGNNLEGLGSLLSNVTRTIPPHGRIRARVSNLHADVAYPLAQAYLEITSDVAIQAAELVKIGDSIAMIPAKARGLPDTAFFAAQFASGGAATLDTPISSHLALANSSEVPLAFTMQITDEKGAIVPAGSSPIRRTLQPHEVLQGGADALFNLPNPLTDPALYVGSLKITAEHSGLIGDVIFGDARNGRYLTALSLGASPLAAAGFAHFAEGRFGEPAKGLYTGIAILNPARETADVVIQAYSPLNVLLGKTEVFVDAGKRVSRTIGELLPAITQQNGGSIRITSNVPVYLFEVFGSAESEFLAAVPPTGITITP